MEALKSSELCLQAYIEKFGYKLKRNKSSSKLKEEDVGAESKPKEPVNKNNNDAVAVETDDAMDGDVETEAETDLASEEEEDKGETNKKDNMNEEKEYEISVPTQNQEVNLESTLGQLLALANAVDPKASDEKENTQLKKQKTISNDFKSDVSSKDVENSNSEPLNPEKSLPVQNGNELLGDEAPVEPEPSKNIISCSLPANGLTLDNCGALTIGELFLRVCIIVTKIKCKQSFSLNI